MLFLLAVPSSFAWDSIGAVWSDDAFPLTWYLQGSLPEVDDADAEAAAQAAFDTWASVDCAGLSFTYGGRVDDAEIGVADGRSVVFLVDEGWPGETSLVSSPFLTTSSNSIVDGDVALDGVGYAWATVGADGRTRMDVQASVTHEVGHLLGLWHSTAGDATLNPSLDGNPDARDLAEDDIEGICALYDLVRGSGAVGDACDTTADCGAGLECLVDGADRYCTTACSTDDDCADGYACLDAGGESLCAQVAAEAGCGCDTTPSGLASLTALLATSGALFRARSSRRR